MFLIAIFYTSLLFLFEFGVFSKIRAKLQKKSATLFDTHSTDEDVHEENQRVQTLVTEGEH